MSNFILEKWKKYKEVIAIISFIILAASFIMAANDTQKKVKSFEQTFERISQIAEDLSDPNTWLRQYLLNHNIDSATAKIWSVMPKGEIIVKNDTLTNIPYLNPQALPDVGIQLIRKPDGTTKMQDTLWNFTKMAK